MIALKKLFTRKPWILSVIILFTIVLWLFSGLGQSKQSNDTTDASLNSDNATSPPLAKVVVSRFNSQPVTRTLSLYGRTAPNRQATLGAEVSGTVAQLLVKKGQHVKTGQALIELNKADRELQLQRANALLKVRDQEYKAAQSLRKRGLQGEVALSQAEAALIEAKAAVRKLQIALDNTIIYAPFSSIVETLHVEQGGYLGIGDPAATLVDLNPLLISADVSERHVGNVSIGQSAAIELVTGLNTQGTVSYRASVASKNTNTFPIEIEIDNPDMTLTAGTSTNVELVLANEQAIKITPSMLALDEAGNLGIKTLTNNDLVLFVPIAIVKVESDGVWLSGTSNPVDVITVGQGFARDGDTVIPTRQDGSQ